MAFRRAKEIVCVSRNLLEAIPKKYQSKARFIPHGVDTEFWDPALAKMPAAFPEGGYVLCVGAHGLDLDLFREFIEANPSVPFVMVGVKDKLGNHSNAHYLSKISDEDLRDLYLGASLTFRSISQLPLTTASSNPRRWAKPVPANRISGVTDYLTDDTCVFIDTLRDKFPVNLQALRLDPVALRQTAIEKFSWPRIINDYIAIYNQ